MVLVQAFSCPKIAPGARHVIDVQVIEEQRRVLCDVESPDNVGIDKRDSESYDKCPVGFVAAERKPTLALGLPDCDRFPANMQPDMPIRSLSAWKSRQQ